MAIASPCSLTDLWVWITRVDIFPCQEYYNPLSVACRSDNLCLRTVFTRALDSERGLHWIIGPLMSLALRVVQENSDSMAQKYSSRLFGLSITFHKKGPDK